MSFINIPLRLGDVRHKADLQRISLKESVHTMIHMVTTTAYGEVRYNPSFGCDIWRFDFENIYNPHSFKDDLKKSLQNSIRTNEPRLVNVVVDLQLEQMEVPTRIRNKRIKTRIMIVVNAVIEKTNEPFVHQEMFFIGPLSYY
jgi:phage baseplate assembly protein W